MSKFKKGDIVKVVCAESSRKGNLGVITDVNLTRKIVTFNDGSTSLFFEDSSLKKLDGYVCKTCGKIVEGTPFYIGNTANGGKFCSMECIEKDLYPHEDVPKIKASNPKDALGVKNDIKDNKLPFNLIPVAALIGYAEVMRMGATKYEPRNWEKGIEYSRLYAAALRHLLSWYQREDTDKESGLSHLKHCFWNIGALIHFVEKQREDLDDRPL